MIYVYTLADPPDTLQGTPAGFGGAPLEVVTRKGVAAVYSGLIGPPPEPVPEQLWRHEEIVEALMDRVAILPARFGTVGEDPGWLLDLLERHAGVIGPALDRTRGMVEVGVRVRSLAPAVEAGSSEPTGTGRAYLLERVRRERARQERRREAEGLARTVLAPLGALAAAERVEATASGSVIASAAYLTDPATVDELSAQVAAIDAEHTELELLATGPWPPYSFVPELDLRGVTGA